MRTAPTEYRIAYLNVVPAFEKMTGVAMQAEESCKAVVREYVEAFNRGDLQRLKELLADDAEIQGVKGKGTFEKVEPVWRQLIEGYGIQLKIEGLIAEGNTVAIRYVESGTFRAPAFGNQPTGRSYELVAMEWFEIESGRIKRRWGARDAAAQARQLGIAPA
jgi:predicted ester cyclase